MHKAETCKYDNKTYSIGSITCQNGRECVCDTDGTWHETGNGCTTNKPFHVPANIVGASVTTAPGITSDCVQVVPGTYEGATMPLVNKCHSFAHVKVIWDGGTVQREYTVFPGAEDNTNTWLWIPIEGTTYKLIQ
jgi:hypothetical protein